MTEIKILDKEKDYLLNVNPYEFVDNLDSASIFYELLYHDNLLTEYHLTNTEKTYKDYKTLFNNISLVGIYNCLLNLICCNLYEVLSFRHYFIYKKQDKEIDLRSFGLHITSVNYKSDKTIQEFEYLCGTVYRSNHKVFDTIDTSIKNLNMFEHRIVFYKDDIGNDFLSKMLILYEDFVDNIPI
jgi:hypothetical protein